MRIAQAQRTLCIFESPTLMETIPRIAVAWTVRTSHLRRKSALWRKYRAESYQFRRRAPVSADEMSDNMRRELLGLTLIDTCSLCFFPVHEYQSSLSVNRNHPRQLRGNTNTDKTKINRKPKRIGVSARPLQELVAFCLKGGMVQGTMHPRGPRPSVYQEIPYTLSRWPLNLVIPEDSRSTTCTTDSFEKLPFKTFCNIQSLTIDYVFRTE